MNEAPAEPPAIKKEIVYKQTWLSRMGSKAKDALIRILIILLVVVMSASAGYFFGYNHGFEKAVQTTQHLQPITP